MPAAPNTRLYFGAIQPRVDGPIMIERQIGAILGKRSRAFVRDYQSVSNKFKNQRVTYKTRVTRGVPPTGGSPRMYGVGYTDHPVMWWLDLGTRVRYAIMSSDFISMTIPNGGLTTRRGRGQKVGLTFIDQGGIKPRKFTEAVAEKNAELFYADVERFFRSHSIRFIGRSRIVY